MNKYSFYVVRPVIVIEAQTQEGAYAKLDKKLAELNITDWDSIDVEVEYDAAADDAEEMKKKAKTSLPVIDIFGHDPTGILGE